MSMYSNSALPIPAAVAPTGEDRSFTAEIREKSSLCIIFVCNYNTTLLLVGSMIILPSATPTLNCR